MLGTDTFDITSKTTGHDLFVMVRWGNPHKIERHCSAFAEARRAVTSPRWHVLCPCLRWGLRSWRSSARLERTRSSTSNTQTTRTLTPLLSQRRRCACHPRRHSFLLLFLVLLLLLQPTPGLLSRPLRFFSLLPAHSLYRLLDHADCMFCRFFHTT